jgi:hypothetical protein
LYHFLGQTVGELPKYSSNHDQVAKKKGKTHVDASAEVKRRTNPKIKTRDAADMAGINHKVINLTTPMYHHPDSFFWSM